jgi:outer membrane immunogenic protein
VEGALQKALWRFLVGATICSAEPAFAADMGLPVSGPAPEPGFTWTGIYAGVNVGDGWSKPRIHFSNGSTIDFGTIQGVIGGGQVGANWQFGRIVLGIEADVDGSSQSKSAAATIPVGIFNVSGEIDKPWFATFRGRVAWAVADRWLVYATGGASWLDRKSTFTFSTAGSSASSGFEVSHIGWAAGGGVEGPLTRNWSWKIEYLYLQTEKFVTTINWFGNPLLHHDQLGESVARIGVNYRIY